MGMLGAVLELDRSFVACTGVLAYRPAAEGAHAPSCRVEPLDLLEPDSVVGGRPESFLSVTYLVAPRT
jgi:hypothetical protein